MGNPIKMQPLNRRAVLIAAGATSLLGLMSDSADAKIAQTGVRYQELPQGRQTVRWLQTIYRAKRVQNRGWRYITAGVVRAVGQEVTSSASATRLPLRAEAKSSASSTTAARIEAGAAV